MVVKMARSLLIFLFVITISQYGLAVKCSDTSREYRAAGVEFYDTYTEMLNSTINKEMVDNRTVIALTEKSTNFLTVSKQFCNASINETWNHEILIKLMEFSLQNATLIRDLVVNHRFKCINELKPEINACYKNASQITLWGRLFARSYLTFNGVTCPQTNRNSQCVVDILQKKCDPVLTNYVKSLFDFMSDNYCKDVIKNEPNSTSNNGGVRVKVCLASVALFALELALMIQT